MPGCAIVVPAAGTLSRRALPSSTLVRQRAVAASCFVNAPSVRTAVACGPSAPRPEGSVVLLSRQSSWHRGSFPGAAQTPSRLFSGP
ncbi:uncharacterized protein SCHCODRAFT_02642296 [Schizophyllum commune H4-8]|uniref:uncharacterized protein n=1 Tax=Schizophyllum commune (strain H4-8 / FGSC 9210) TaxID=578458 RepID=UPI00215FCF29|nr:uncharacterized protein SCHCODRAFT_02642296 [Schizophyllum commune H4-8]KAI5886654.1 hypothetical protein SCHCODRAFT_02642296 [Schizophyllum commune H4-8]